MQTKQLSVSEILKGGISLGMKNLFPIIINYILFLLTFWIPYLNIGTFIGMSSGIPLKMSKDEVISPTEIFESEYRKNFGEYFILMGLMLVAIYFGYSLVIIPGIVLMYVWYIADMLFLDGKAGILDSLKKSNDLTYGNKMTIFLASLLFIFAILLAYFIAFVLLRSVPFLGGLIILASVLLVIPFSYGIKAYVYKELVSDDANTEVLDN